MIIENKTFFFTEDDVLSCSNLEQLSDYHRNQMLTIDEIKAKIDICDLEIREDGCKESLIRKTKIHRALNLQYKLLKIIEDRMAFIKNVEDIPPFDDAAWWFDNLTDVGMPNKKINQLLDNYEYAKQHHRSPVH